MLLSGISQSSSPSARSTQLFEALDEAGGRGAVDDVMVDTDRDTHILPDFYVLSNHAGLFGDAAQGELEGMVGDGNPPAAARAEHPQRRDQDRAIVLLDPAGIFKERPEEEAPDQTGQAHKAVDELRFPTALMLALECTDFFVNLSNAFLVHRPDDVRPDRLPAVHLDLEQHVHVHLIKNDELVAPVAVGVHLPVGFDGFPQAGEEEGGEGEGFSGPRLMAANDRARQCDIEFEQAVDGVLLQPHPTAIDHEEAGPGIGQDGVEALVWVHGSSFEAGIMRPATRARQKPGGRSQRHCRGHPGGGWRRRKPGRAGG